MSASHEDLRAMTSGYVLGLLDDHERQELEAHLPNCGECAAEVRSLLDTVDALARSIPQRTPPADLRERVMALARREIASAPAAPRAGWERRLWLPMAASLLIALGAGIYGSHLHVETRLAALSDRAEASDRAIADARREAADARRAMRILAAPDAMRIDLSGQGPAAGATARALWSRHHGVVFAGTNIPPAPVGHQHHVWILTDAAAVSAGTLPQGGDQFAVFSTAADMPQPRGVSVTLQPAGGATVPSGAQVLLGSRPTPF